MRLFVAVPLAAAVIDELWAISVRLQAEVAGFRWMAPSSWHITLQFLGNTEREQYECTIARLRGVHLPPVPIRLEGLGIFDRTGVFYAGVNVSPELLLLQERVNKAAALCAFTPEARPFRPHITLARSKGGGQRQSFSELRNKISSRREFSRFVAEEFILYESFLGSGGSRYEVRERFPLDGR